MSLEIVEKVFDTPVVLGGMLMVLPLVNVLLDVPTNVDGTLNFVDIASKLSPSAILLYVSYELRNMLKKRDEDARIEEKEMRQEIKDTKLEFIASVKEVKGDFILMVKELHNEHTALINKMHAEHKADLIEQREFYERIYANLEGKKALPSD